MQYVGMTRKALYECFNEHMSAIRRKTMTSVAAHFNLPGHSMEDLTIMIIDQDNDVETLKIQEKYWINELRTKAPDGINRR